MTFVWVDLRTAMALGGASRRRSEFRYTLSVEIITERLWPGQQTSGPAE
jgi:hypothetical protein